MYVAEKIEKNAHVWKREEHDWYVEPEWCVDLLIDKEPFEGGIYDPCCGMGTIPKTFERRGFEAHGSDIDYRGYGSGYTDFLTASPEVDNIVCNPPYKLTEQFIDHALKCVKRKVAVIVPLKFLASQSRKPLFEDRWPISKVYVLSKRPSMLPGHRILAGEKPGGGAIDYVWLVFEHGHDGPPTMGWLSFGGRKSHARGGARPSPELSLQKEQRDG